MQKPHVPYVRALLLRKSKLYSVQGGLVVVCRQPLPYRMTEGLPEVTRPRLSSRLILERRHRLVNERRL